MKKFIKHFKLITKHKFIVFKLSIKAGIPLQGLVHDLSKYSYTEFSEGIKYYTGNNYSPIANCKKANGYSRAWLHHKGRNKHHHEYWNDYYTPDQTPVIPFKYMAEMVCDTLASGMVYQGKNWTNDYQLSYWNNHKDKVLMNDKLKLFLSEIYTDIAKNGINKVVNKNNLRNVYNKYTKGIKYEKNKQNKDISK